MRSKERGLGFRDEMLAALVQATTVLAPLPAPAQFDARTNPSMPPLSSSIVEYM